MLRNENHKAYDVHSSKSCKRRAAGAAFGSTTQLGHRSLPGDPFYQRAAWRRFRAGILRHRPICEVPGCGIAASHVDHIIPRRRGGADFDPANVQALCASCHSAKTALRDGGFGHRSKPGARIRLSGCDLTGLPRDPGHPWRTEGA